MLVNACTTGEFLKRKKKNKLKEKETSCCLWWSLVGWLLNNMMESEDNNSWLHLADLEVFSTSNQSTPSRHTRNQKSSRSQSSSKRARSRPRQQEGFEYYHNDDVDEDGAKDDDQLILNLANSRFEFSAMRISNHTHTQLTHLNLSQNNLQAIPLDTLRPLRQLKMLNLSHNFIDSMWGLHFQVKLE